MTHRVTTVITSHNKGATIRRAVLAVASQTCPPDSILVLEDCSTDNTAEVLSGLRDSVPNFRVLHYPEKSGDWGTDMLRHAAALDADAGADYVHLLAADDYPVPDFYGQMAEGMATGAGVLFSNVRVIHADGAPLCQSCHRLPPGHHDKSDSLFGWLSSPGVLPGGTGVLLSLGACRWLHDTGAARLGPWLDSLGFPAAAWALGCWYTPEIGGVFTYEHTGYGGEGRPDGRRLRERPLAEEFFSDPLVRRDLTDRLRETLLAKVPH